MSENERSGARVGQRARGRLDARRLYEQRLRSLLGAAEPALRLLARDDRARDAEWVFMVLSQADIDVEWAPPEILAAMRGLCPEEPVVALVPVQRLIDELTPEAALDERVLSFFERARKPAEEGHLKVIIFNQGRYELIGAPFEPAAAAGNA